MLSAPQQSSAGSSFTSSAISQIRGLLTPPEWMLPSCTTLHSAALACWENGAAGGPNHPGFFGQGATGSQPAPTTELTALPAGLPQLQKLWGPRCSASMCKPRFTINQKEKRAGGKHLICKQTERAKASATVSKSRLPLLAHSKKKMSQKSNKLC